MNKLYEEIVSETELSFDFFGNIKVIKKHTLIQLIGVGKTAAVFLILDTNKVIKIFHSCFSEIASKEKEVYLKIKGIDAFPTMFDYGKTYLVLECIKGNTLYDYLINGFEIEDNHLKEVDEILTKVEKKGITPADVHLKNIIISEKGLRIIDVAQFNQKKPCFKWKHLKNAYKNIYKKKLFPRKIPKVLMELFSILYRKVYSN